MEEVGLRYQPNHLGITRDVLTQALLNLRHYVDRRRDLWYTAINERDISRAWVADALASLNF
jgi:hypothetical protein